MDKTKHYYIINSKHKTSGESDNNFSTKPHEFNKITSFSIKEVLIPHTYYNINSTNNQINIFKNGDTLNRLATLTVGNYTITTLLPELKSKLDALAGPVCTFTITLNNTTNKLTIASSINTIIRGGNALTTLYNIIGFPISDTTSSNSHTGVSVINLSYTNHIKIYSNQLTKYDSRIRTSGNDENDLLCYIPVHNTTFGQFIRWKPKDMLFDYHPHAENRIDIVLKDENDNLLGGDTALNNQSIYMKLQYHSVSNNDFRKQNRFDPTAIIDGGGDYYNY